LPFLLKIAFGQIRHLQIEWRVTDEEINLLYKANRWQDVCVVFENVFDDNGGPVVIPRAHHVATHADEQFVLDAPTQSFVVGDFLHVVVHDGFFQTVLMKTAPVELLHAVKLIHQLRFPTTSLFAFLSVNVAGARLNSCRVDAGIERGIEQLTRANLRSRNVCRLKETFEILRPVQRTEFEKTPSFNVCDEVV
jgi:hypothetical protein